MTNQDQMRVAFDAWSRKWCDGVLNSDDDAGRVSRLGAWAAWQAATAAARTVGDVGEPVAWCKFADNGNIRLWSPQPSGGDDGQIPLYTADQLAAAVRQALGIPDGMLDRIDAAIDRIVNGNASMRVPAEPTDPDLVLGEVKAFLTGRRPPFWIKGGDAIRGGKGAP